MSKAVVFDLDDTLYPESEYIQTGFKNVTQYIQNSKGIDCGDELNRQFLMDRHNVYNRTLAKFNVDYDEKFIAELVSLYRNHMPYGLSFFDDVIPTLDALKQLGMKLGIITDGRVDGQKNKLQVLKCDELFDNIIITDSLGGENYRKPNEKAFVLMAQKFKIRLDEMIYVGDNPQKDFAIGEKGVITVMIKRHGLYGDCDYFKGIKPNFMVENLQEIMRILTGQDI